MAAGPLPLLEAAAAAEEVVMRSCGFPSARMIGDPSDGHRPVALDFDSLFASALVISQTRPGERTTAARAGEAPPGGHPLPSPPRQSVPLRRTADCRAGVTPQRLCSPRCMRGMRTLMQYSSTSASTCARLICVRTTCTPCCGDACPVSHSMLWFMCLHGMVCARQGLGVRQVRSPRQRGGARCGSVHVELRTRLAPAQ